MANNLFETVYNTLSTLFVGNGLQSSAELPSMASGEEPQMLKASSPVEMADMALQTQQQRYLNKQFYQLISSNNDRVLSYEPNRQGAYMDYRQMENYPTIFSALNLLAEESTTTGQDGKMLKIYSSNKRVKQVLENLFYNVLDVNTTLPFWARNLCKYGDNFALLLMHPENGIEGYKQLSAEDIERKEEIVNNRIEVKYKHKMQSMSNEYNVWQIAHFRLLGDERRLPYGTSVLDSIRRTWKMLTMCEDAMMVYRITRAAERRVFKVFVGNAKDSEEVKQIMQAVIKQHKGARLTDPMTGDFNFKYNVASNDQDIYVPVRSENAGNMIETLPGAGNLDQIADISYLRDNLFTGLGIPKSFLGFSDGGAGDGKSLSMLDIRFARKVNRIQQSLIAELNKIAIIHLALLGGDYLEHLNNFTLTLSNPSTQSEMLKIETIKLKLDAYAAAVTPSEKGIAPMSESMAAREILGISDEDRIDDLQEQFLESKVGDEIKSAGQLLKSSKLYDKMIKYENAGFSTQDTSNAGGDAGGGMGGGDPMGGPPPGGDAIDMTGPPGGDTGNAPGAAPLNEEQIRTYLEERKKQSNSKNEDYLRTRLEERKKAKNPIFEANMRISRELAELAESLKKKNL